MTTAGFEADQLLCEINKNSSRISNRINRQYVCMHGHHILYSKGKDQPGKVASPARDQLNFPCPRSRLRIWSRETGSVVPSRVGVLISMLRLNLT